MNRTGRHIGPALLRRMTAGGAVAFALAAVLSLPGAAFALIGPNDYGQVFAGKENCLSCHGATSGRWQTGTYVQTNHAKFITDVQADPTKLVPGPSLWPSPAYGGGLSFGATDIKWMLAAPTMNHQFVTKWRNDVSHTLGSGMTVNPVAAAPADDYIMTNGIEWSTHDTMWEVLAKPSARGYFQSCGGCHFLGVTRPTDATYTIEPGVEVGRSTETSYSGRGIQCENCHGTGKAGTPGPDGTSHWTSGVQISRTERVMKSETCGQCHVNGTAKQKNFAGSALFGSPNGFTTDRKLSDYFDVAGTSYIRAAASQPEPIIPVTDTKFYPNGANKKMSHGFYNEWMLSGHARSLRWQDGSLWSEYADDSCLRCHSGEGFLASLDYGKQGPNDVGIKGSSLKTDKLDIECAVCHQVHGQSGEPLGLRLPRNEICGRCHNSTYPEDTEFAPGAYVVHAQREMFEGYGLIGVEAGGSFHGEKTTCPDCHMPVTYKYNESHRMKGLLPGDAEAWALPEGRDSCTPCHGSRSRGELQADLDTWKDSLAKRTAEASVAVAAAKARPGATAAQGVNLLGSAKTNMALVASDGSNGAHNYPYALAGLERARFFARATGSSFTRFGATSYDATTRMAMIYGTLILGDGIPVSGARLAVQSKPAGTTAWSTIGYANAGDDGDFAYAVSPFGTTEYRVSWSPKTGVAYVSGTAKVVRGSSTTIKSSATSLLLGKTVVLRGDVTPVHAGSVTLSVKRGSGAWVYLTARTLSATGTYYHGTWKPYARGTWYARATFAGDANHTGSTSKTVSVVVK